MSDGHSMYDSCTLVLRWTFTPCKSYKCEIVQCDCFQDSNWIWEEEFYFHFTFQDSNWILEEEFYFHFTFNGHSFYVGYSGLCSQSGPTQDIRRIFCQAMLFLQWYCSVLHCFTLDIRFMYDFNTGVKIYSVTIMRNLIEFFKKK